MKKLLFNNSKINKIKMRYKSKIKKASLIIKGKNNHISGHKELYFI